MPRLIDSGTSLDDGIDTSIRVPSVFSTSCTRRPTLLSARFRIRRMRSRPNPRSSSVCSDSFRFLMLGTSMLVISTLSSLSSRAAST